MGKVIAGALCKSCVRSKQLHLYSSANAVSVALLPGVSPWVYIRHEGVVASGSVPLFWGKIQLCKSPCWVLGLWFCWVFWVWVLVFWFLFLSRLPGVTLL